MQQDTRTFLRVGTGVFITGVAFALIVVFTGGMSMHGPRADIGWLGLIVALCCLPLSAFMLLLGFAKWWGERHS